MLDTTLVSGMQCALGFAALCLLAVAPPAQDAPPAPPVQAAEVPLVLYTDPGHPQGVDFGVAFGVAFGDYDGDGWVDIHINLAGNLWRNVGGQTWALAQNLNGGMVFPDYGSSFADYDGDGRADLVTEPRPTRCLRLLRNEGGGAFLDIAGLAGLFEPAVCRDAAETACWGDVDFDGQLDLFLPTYQPFIGGGNQGNYFWRNLGPVGPGGEHAFSEMSVAAGLAIPPLHNRPEGAQLCDYDRDGDLDLYSNGALYQNVSGPGAPRFVALTSTAGLGFESVLDEGAAFFDYDRDGDDDLMVCYASSPGVVLWESRGDGTFFRTEPGVVEIPMLANDNGMSIADWDQDGDLDVTTGFLFRRSWLAESGQRRFAVASHTVSLLQLVKPTIAWADWDRDGDLDALIGNLGTAGEGRAKLYANTTYDASTPASARRYLRVRPVRGGTGGAVRETEFGTVVTVRVEGESGVHRRQHVASGHGYLNQNEYALHFALPDPAVPALEASHDRAAATDAPDLLRQLGAVPLDDARLPADSGWAASALVEPGFDVVADFPDDPAAGLWRVDRHVNPALAGLGAAVPPAREVTVYREGRVELGGCDVTPSPLESPRTFTTAGGLPLPTATTTLPPPVPAAPDTYAGLDVEVGSQHVRVGEILLDGAVDSGAFGLAVWDVTAGAPVVVHASAPPSAPRNHRCHLPVDVLLRPGRRYRIVVRVQSHRASAITAPIQFGGLTTHGGLLFQDTDPASGAAVRTAPLDPTAIRLALRYRPALAGIPIDLGNPIPALGGNTAQLTLTGTFTAGTPFSVSVRNATPNAALALVVGTGVACVGGFGTDTIVPTPTYTLVGPPTVDAQGRWTLAATWPGRVAAGGTLAFQAWYLADAANLIVATTNTVYLTTP